MEANQSIGQASVLSFDRKYVSWSYWAGYVSAGGGSKECVARGI